MNILFLLVIIVLLIIILSKLTAIESLKKSIDQLNKKMFALTDLIAGQQQGEPVLQEKSPPSKEKEIISDVPVITKLVLPEVREVPKKEVETKTVSQTNDYGLLSTDQKMALPGPKNANQSREGWFSALLRNNPDLEKFIGENLINKIGIAVLILGIAFFVKYAIDQNWINEIGRVCIGLLCGIILILVSYKLRKNYRSFSSVLVGGGLTIFYFTIAFAFHQYNLMSQAAAFVMMVVITAFAIALSIIYDRMELAILATIGGFITPLLVSTGQGNYVVLFTYLCILNGGIIILAYQKRWHAIHFIAFAFTALIYGAWVTRTIAKPGFSYTGAFLFASVFYLMFVTMNILLCIKAIKVKASDMSLLISVNVGYYASGIFLLTEWSLPAYKGLFTACIGVFNLILALFFYRRKSIDKNFIYLLIGVTLTFISITAPIQLEGNYITIFWASEMVLLFWLYQRSFIPLMKIASALITLLVLFRLLSDWVQAYVVNRQVLPIIINKGFITTVFTASAMGIMAYLLKKEGDLFYIKNIPNKTMKLLYTTGSCIVFFIAGLLEINYQFSYRYSGTGLEYIYLQMYTIAYFLLLLWLLPIFKIRMNDYVRTGISLVLTVYYLLNIENTYTTEKLLLETGNFKIHYLAHCVAIVLMGILIYQNTLLLRKQHKEFKNILHFFTWITAIVLVIYLSAEIKHLYIWLTFRDEASILYAENLYRKAGLSVVWGLTSFVFIWLGLRNNYKTLRIIALVLFGLTLMKLFAFDIKNIPPGGKILAFILLGVLLLVVSFMYQRLKKLVIDEAARKE